MGKLIVDRRGASLMEYVMLVGLVGLVSAAGFRTFGQSVLRKIEAQAACVLTLDCSGTGNGPDDDGSSSSGETAPQTPPIPTRDEVLAAVETVNSTGDPHAIDSVDRFRQRLTPELQAEYDKLLQQLRDDPRIDFVYQPGVEPNAGRDELALRGVAAAVFGRPELLEDAIQTAVDSRQDEDGKLVEDGNGKLEIVIYPGNVPIEPFYPGSDGEALGLVTPPSDVLIDEQYLYDATAAGEHLLIHEFSHVLQQTSEDGGLPTQRQYPPDFEDGDLVTEATETDPELRAYLTERWGGVSTGLEIFPGLQVVFESYPEELREASPEVYDAFARYHGYDPLTGRRVR